MYPHFEKMLYDNAQMVSLYSKAYAVTKIDWYREIGGTNFGFVKTTSQQREVLFTHRLMQMASISKT
jgi:uncharacterized protein YyaL (SSP411 family)